MDSLREYLVKFVAKTSGVDEAAVKLGKLTKQVAVTILGLKSITSIVMQAARVIKAEVKETVKLNDSLEDTAKSLKKTTDQARAHQIALSVMGKTMQEINKSNNLKKTYNELLAINEAFKFESAPEGTTSIRDLKDEINKIKYTAKLGLSQVYEYFKKYAAEPLQQFRNWLRDLAQKLGTNLKEQARLIGEFAAKVFASLSYHFQHIIGVLERLWSWASRLIKWWSDMSDGAKKASVAVVGAIALITGKLKPLHAMLYAIYLLIDDFVVWSKGGDSYFGGTWEKISEVFSKIGEYLDNDIAKAVTLVAIISKLAFGDSKGSFLGNALNFLGGKGSNGSNGASGSNSSGSSGGGLFGWVKTLGAWLLGHASTVVPAAGAAAYLATRSTAGDAEDDDYMSQAKSSVGFKGDWDEFTSRYYHDSASGQWRPREELEAQYGYNSTANAYPAYTNGSTNNTENKQVTVNVQSTFNVTTSDPTSAASQVNSNLASEIAQNVESALA